MLRLTRLLPGSIVRIDRSFASRWQARPVQSGDQPAINSLWLVDLPDGLTCSAIRWIDDQQIVLLPSRPPWGCWPLRVPTEARIVGMVETQPSAQCAMMPASAGRTMMPEPFSRTGHRKEERMGFSELLRVSRRRTGLTFRSAHRLSRSMARILGNTDYAIALGLLSDYEVMGRLPRHTAKILSLCVVYCMDVWELLQSAGLYIDDSAKLHLPTADPVSPRLDHFDHPGQHSWAVS